MPRPGPEVGVVQVEATVHVACPGITDPSLQKYASLPPPVPDEKSGKYYLEAKYSQVGDRMTCTTTIRAHACERQLQSTEKGLCSPCLECRALVLKKHLRETTSERKQVLKNTPLSRLSKKKVINALKIQRMEKNLREKQLKEIQTKLKEDASVEVSSNSHHRLTELMGTAEKDSFTSMFWEEQKKAFASKKGGMRWHPMMIRFAILIHSQSPSTYRTLREAGAVRLPAESTLRDYTNVLHPQTGFDLNVFLELKKVAEPLLENERWVVLLHDEISIKEDLVYDRVTGELVGFVNPSGSNGTTGEESRLATHALIFMAVGVTSNIKMSLGYFPTVTATSDQIMPWFWQAVGLLETVCNLKVYILLQL